MHRTSLRRAAFAVVVVIALMASAVTARAVVRGNRIQWAAAVRASAIHALAPGATVPATTSPPIEPAPTTEAPTTTTTTTVPPTTVPPPPPITAPAAPAAPVWAGKGMWIWQPGAADGGDGAAIVARAKADGIDTIYVRTGSSHDGLTIGWLLAFLPTAHAAGLRVVGWDFPELDDVAADISRAYAAILATASDGSRIDGFAADIETWSEGTNLTTEGVAQYTSVLKATAPLVPLIACVPNPTPHYQTFFPYAQATHWFDAVAPMVYWLNRDPISDTTQAMQFLAQFGKPIAPIGQSFDGGPEGGRSGMPSQAELESFAGTARDLGAAGVSFWSWQHTDEATFAVIASLPEVGLH